MTTENSRHSKILAQLKELSFVLDIYSKVPALIVVYNIHTGEYIYANESVKALLGYTKEALINGGLPYVTSLVHPDDLQQIITQNAGVIARANRQKNLSKTEIIANFEYRMKHKDGTWRWLHSDGTVFERDEQGKVEYVMNITVDITERRNAEDAAKQALADAKQKMAESEERYQAFVANSNEGIWRLELEQPISTNLTPKQQIKAMYKNAFLAEANQAMARMYGFRSPKQLYGARLNDLLVEDDPKNTAYLESFITANYRLAGVESHEQDSKGHDKYFQNSLVGIVKDGMVLRVWGTQLDITEKHKTALELERSQDRLTLALQASKLGMWEWNVETNELMWSDQLKRIFGYKPKDVITYERYLSNLHPDDRIYMKKTIDRAMKHGKSYAVEHRAVWPDGSIHWIQGHGQAILEGGKPVLMIGTSMNIDERKQQEKKLLESEAKFRRLFDRAPDAIFIATPDTIIRDANNAAAKLLGYTHKELLKVSMHDLIRIEELPRLVALQNSGGTDRDYYGEWELRHKKGHYIYAELAARILPDGQWLAFARDITDRKKNELAIQEARVKEEVLEQNTRLLQQQHRQMALLNKAKDEFLSVASHHLRTPVTAVKTYLAMLMEGFAGALSKEQAAYIRQAFDSNEQQLQVIEEIMNVAEIDTNQVVIRRKKHNMVSLTQEVIDSVGEKFELRNQQVTFKASAISIAAYVDTVKIRLVLENLIGNASKYSPENTHIQVAVKKVRDKVQITVSDQGVGIPRRDLSKIFEKFARVRNETYRSESGTGLGLYWAKRIIELHNGTISVKSQVKRGSTFTLTLPVKGK